jgi:Trypsin
MAAHSPEEESMRRSVFALTVVVALLALVVVPAGAITNGTPDGDDHPYVGLVVFHDEEGIPLWRCSGSLLSETVFLTAGHCVEPPAATAVVWFDSGYPDPIPLGAGYPAAGPNPCAGITGYPCTGDATGTPNVNPDYCPSPCGNGLPGFAFRDVGVVVLDSPVPTSLVAEYAELPTAGQVDTLSNKTAVDLVGYGVQQQHRGGGPPFWTGLRVRMYAPSELVSGNFVHSDEFIKLALNPGGGSGGLCFGDSGGPDLLGGTDTVLAVNSYVTNSNCSGVGYSSRVDIPDVLSWIQSFMD